MTRIRPVGDHDPEEPLAWWRRTMPPRQCRAWYCHGCCSAAAFWDRKSARSRQSRLIWCPAGARRLLRRRGALRNARFHVVALHPRSCCREAQTASR